MNFFLRTLFYCIHSLLRECIIFRIRKNANYVARYLCRQKLAYFFLWENIWVKESWSHWGGDGRSAWGVPEQQEEETQFWVPSSSFKVTVTVGWAGQLSPQPNDREGEQTLNTVITRMRKQQHKMVVKDGWCLALVGWGQESVLPDQGVSSSGLVL